MDPAKVVWGALPFAAAILALGLVAMRLLERRWFAPAGLFFVAFFAHGFLDPLARAGRDYFLNASTLPQVMAQTLASFLLLVTGYSIVQAAMFVREPSPVTPARLSSPYRWSGIQLATIATGLILVSMFVTLWKSGALTEAKGFTAYQGGAIRQALLLNTAIYALLGSLFMAIWQFDGRRRRVVLMVVGVAVGLVLLHSVLQFARRGIITVGLIVGILFHYRVRSVRPREFALALLFLLGVTVVSFGRSLGSGILGLDPGAVQALADFVKEEPFDILRAMTSSIPGQAVLSQTMVFVPGFEEFRYGATYLESLRSLVMPNILSGTYDLQTPAFWFKEVYAPERTGHGFDFSMLAEAYMNFGSFGPLVFFFIGGLLAIVSRAIRTAVSPVMVLWSVIILVDLIVGLRNDSNAVLKRMVFFMAPVLGVMLAESVLVALRTARHRIRPL